MCHVIHRYEDLLVGPKTGVAPADETAAANFVLDDSGSMDFDAGRIEFPQDDGRPT